MFSLMITRTIIIIAVFVSIAILAAPRKKSNTGKEQRKRTEKWAIIGREYVEFDEDEIRWRAGK